MEKEKLTKEAFEELHKKIQAIIFKLDEMKISYQDEDSNDRIQKAIDELSALNTEAYYQYTE